MSKSLLSLLFVPFFLHVCGAVSAIGRPTQAPTPAPCAGPLECALDNAVLGPFNFCVDIPTNESDIFGLCVNAFYCRHIVLDTIYSDYLSPHSLYMGVTGLGISCSGHWNVTLNSSDTHEVTLLYDGDFTADISDLDAHTTMKFARYNSLRLPTELTFVDCNTTSVEFDIHFIGGAIGTTLDKTLAPKLETALEDYTDVLICDLIGPLVENLLTVVLVKKVNPRFTSYLEAAKNPPVVSNMDGYYDWKESPIQTIHNLLNMFGGSSTANIECLLNTTASFMSDDDSALDVPYIDKLIDVLTNSTGSVSIDLNEYIPLGNSTNSITIEKFVINGLDTFENIEIMVPSTTSNVALTSSIGLEVLSIDLHLLVNFSHGYYMEEIIVTLEVTDVLISIDLVIALKESVLGELYLDQLLNSTCIGTALDLLEIGSFGLFMDVDEISITQISGGDATELEHDMVELIDNLFETILHSYPITNIIAGFAQTTLRDSLNANLDLQFQSIKSMASTCRPHVDYTTINYMVWTSSDLISTLNLILNQKIGASGLNDLMTCLTNGTGNAVIHISSDKLIESSSHSHSSNIMHYMTAMYETTKSFAESNSAIIHQSETLDVLPAATTTDMTITLSGLNTFYEFAFMYPVAKEPYDLGTRIGVGYCEGSSATEENGCVPFGLTISGYLNDRHIYLGVELLNFDLYVDLLLMLDMNTLKDLQVSQMSVDGCRMTAVDALQIYKSSATLTEASLVLRDGNTNLNITDAVDYILSAINSKGGISSTLNENWAESISTAEARCDGSYVPDTDGSASTSNENNKWTWQLALLMVGCAVALFVLMYIYYKYGTKNITKQCNAMMGREEVDDENLTAQQLERQSQIFRVQHPYSPAAIGSRIAAYFGYPNFNYDALIANNKIPIWVRLLFPCAVLFNIGLFMTANIQVGTSVMVQLDIGQQQINPPSIFDFGLANTVRDMWSAGVYPLSILIAFFSGAWPYIKLACMFVSWLTPSAAMNVTRRDWLLRWLDILGKWSLIDAYVMVIMIVAFYVQLELAPGLSVLVYVVPKSGFNNFLLATMMSLGLGHIALASHRLTTEKKVASNDFTTESLMNHVYNSSMWRRNTTFIVPGSAPATYRKSNIKFQFTYFGKVLVGCLILLAVVIVVFGCWLMTYAFHFEGLTGYLLKSDANIDYSLIKTGINMADATGDPNSFNTRWIQASFFAFGMVMPLLFLTVLFMMWVVPLTLNTFRQLVVLAEVANAWNAVDVFVVCIIAALLEIHQFALFIIGDSCDGINQILEQYFDDQLNGNDTCFDVIASIKTDYWVLCVAAFLMLFGGLPIVALCNAAIHDRLMLTTPHLDNTASDMPVVSIAQDEKRSSMVFNKSFAAMENSLNGPLDSTADQNENEAEDEVVHPFHRTVTSHSEIELDDRARSRSANTILRDEQIKSNLIKNGNEENFSSKLSYNDLIMFYITETMEKLNIITVTEY